MTHFIRTHDVREKLYLLMEMVLAAEKIVSRYGVGVEGCERVISKESYWMHTKSTVSNYCIEIAVKLRAVEDTLKSNRVNIDPIKSINVYHLNVLPEIKNEKRDFRFICNKIIHASSFQVDAIGTVKHKDLLWWSGTLALSGTENHNGWRLFFNVLDWCEASLIFLDKIEDSLKVIQLNSEDLFLRLKI